MIKFSIDSTNYFSGDELADYIFSTLYGLELPSRGVSVDTLQWVMKVPMAALKAIGREAQITIEDKPGACIDENALGCFADAYVRKMKHYFHQSRRYKNRLSPEEKRRTYHILRSTVLRNLNYNSTMQMMSAL